MVNKNFHVFDWRKLSLQTADLQHYAVRLKRFAQDYSLPLVATALLLLLLAVGVYAKDSEHITTATILRTLDSNGADYGTLLSNDKTSSLTVENDSGSSSVNSSSVATGTASSFTVNTNTPSGTTSGGSSAPVFSAVIASFDQGSVTLQCTKSKLKLQWCSKQYAFAAAVSTQNGPGTVDYGWRSTIPSATTNGSISVGSGNVVSTLPKTITLSCTVPMVFTLQFVIQSPDLTQSAIITVNHNCNGI